MKKYIYVVALFLLLIAGIAGFRMFSVMNINELNKGLTSNSQEIRKIHFIHWGTFPAEIFKRFSEKYPNISVDFEQIGEEQYAREQKSRIASGYNVDLMGIKQNDYRGYIQKGYMVDLSNMNFLNNYLKSSRDSLKKLSGNEKEYAVAYRNWVLGIWYNKILFSRYDIKVPTNYREFVNVCEKLKQKGVSPIVLGGRDDWTSSYIFLLRVSNLVSQDKEWFVKLDNGSIKWTDAKMKDALKEIDEFVDKGYIKEESKNITGHQAFADFAKGKAAMTITKDWSINMVKQDLEKVCDPGVFPMPFNDSEELKAVPGCSADYLTGIFSGSNSLQEAQLLLDFISRKENAQIYTDITMTIPTIIGVDTSKLKYNNLWEPLKNMEHISTGVLNMEEETQKKINRMTKEMLAGQTEYEKVLDELQELQDSQVK